MQKMEDKRLLATVIGRSMVFAKRPIWKLCLILFFMKTLCLAEDKVEFLAVGGAINLPLPKDKYVWVEQAAVVVVKQRRQQLVMLGKKMGSSKVRVGEQSYKFVVTTEAAVRASQKLNEIFKNMRGLRLGEADGLPAVVGRLLRFRDWQEIADSMREDTHSYCYAFAAELSDEVAETATKHFVQILTQQKLPQFPLVFSNGPAHIYISDKHSNLLARYQSAVNRYGVHVDKDTGLLETAPLILVEITMAEVKRRAVERYGIAPPTTLESTLSQNPQTFLETAKLSLNFLEQNGDGRILASPKILCRSGKEADFLAGGEVPIKIMSFKFSDVVWKKYGVMLKVKPTADLNNKMSIEISTEVSTLDFANSSDGIPGILTNRIQTHFDLERPSTVVLSGLLKNEKGHATSGLMGLSRLPIIGQLFSSKDWQENRTELVAYVTPKIVTPQNVPPGAFGKSKTSAHSDFSHE